MKIKYYAKIVGYDMRPQFIKISKLRAYTLLHLFYDRAVIKTKWERVGRKKNKIQIKLCLELQRGCFTKQQIKGE